MKTRVLLILMMLLPLVACSQSRLLSSFPTGDGISKVYISPAMMKLGKGYVYSTSQFGDAIKNPQSVEVYNCDSKKLYRIVCDEFEKLLKSLNVEELVYSEDGGDVSRIYLYTDKGASEPSGMIIFNADSDSEVSIVVIHGKIGE